VEIILPAARTRKGGLCYRGLARFATQLGTVLFGWLCARWGRPDGFGVERDARRADLRRDVVRQRFFGQA
jgi:hypothetical protein